MPCETTWVKAKPAMGAIGRPQKQRNGERNIHSAEIGPDSRSGSYAAWSTPKSGWSGTNQACTWPGSMKHEEKEDQEDDAGAVAERIGESGQPAHARDAARCRRASRHGRSSRIRRSTLLSTTIAATKNIWASVEFGTPNQVPAKLKTIMPAKIASHGLRGPPLSAMAPMNGAQTALMKPVQVTFAPQFLAAHRVAHHHCREERRDHIDLENDIGIARRFEERPAPLSELRGRAPAVGGNLMRMQDFGKARRIRYQGLGRR